MEAPISPTTATGVAPQLPFSGAPDRAAWAWFAGAATLYVAGAAPGVLWADSAKLTLYALAGYLPSLNPGDHPGWTAVARAWLALVPAPAPAALALLSAVAGAAAVALLYAIVTRWTGDRARGHAAAAVLLVAHGPWWAAEVPESYAVGVALALLAVWASIRDGGAAALLSGAATGLAAACHLFTLVLTGPLLATRRRLPAVVVGAVLGSAPLWLGLIASPVDPLTGHLSGGAGSWSWHLETFIAPARVGRGIVLVLAFLALNLGLLGAAGVIRSLRPAAPSPHPRPRLAGAALAALALLLLAYSPFRLHLMVGVLVVGLLLLAPPRLSRRTWLVHLPLQAALFAGLALGAHWIGRADLGIRRLPRRDNAWYFLEPMKRWNYGARRYAEALLRAAPADAVVIADFNPGAPLVLVQRLEGLRRDVAIAPTAVDEALGSPDPPAALAARIQDVLAGGRPAVLADSWPPYYHPTALTSRFGLDLIPCGPGWRVVHGGWSPSAPERAADSGASAAGDAAGGVSAARAQ